MNLEKKHFVACAQACINSYKSKYGTEDWSFLTNVEWFRIPFREKENSSIDFYVDGYFADYEDFFMICFQGTSGLEDWINNLKFFKQKATFSPLAQGIEAHGGFLKQYEVVKDLIHSKIQGKTKILVTGHSLGAAITTLCAYDLCQTTSGIDITCVALASPRVFNIRGSKDFDRIVTDSYRFTFRNDIVCNVPPPIFFFNHCGNAFVHLCPPSWGYQILHPIFALFGNAADHYPQHYLDHISGL